MLQIRVLAIQGGDKLTPLHVMVANHHISITYKGWVSDYQQTNTPGERLALLAPGKIKAKAVESYPWMAEFLRFYCTPKRPTVAMAFEDFEAEWENITAIIPS